MSAHPGPGQRDEPNPSAVMDWFQNIVELSADSIYIKDLEGKYLYCNAAAAAMVGRTAEELVGLDASQVLGSEQGTAIHDYDRRVIESGIDCEEEMTISPAGIPRLYSIRKSPFRGKDGKIIGLIGIARDITKRVDAERQLRLMQFAIDHAVESIFWIDSGARIMYANEAACRTLGYTRDELLTLKVADIDPNYSLDTWPERWNELKRRGSLTVESTQITKHGLRIETEVTANYLIHEGQEYNCAVVRNISDRKRAELELRRSEERFAKLFYYSPFSIMVATYPEGRIIDANDAYLKRFADRREDVVGKTTDELNIWVNPADRQTMLDSLIKHKRLPKGEFWFRTKTGEERLLMLAVELIEIQGQSVSLAMSFDVTDRRLAEDALERTISQLRATLESTADGILVVDLNGKVIDFNHQLQKICNFPIEVIADGSDVNLIPLIHSQKEMPQILEQLQNPEQFAARTKEIYQSPNESTFDLLEFRDGRVIERYSQPQRSGGVPIGRVWSFRDVTIQRQLEQQVRDAQKMEAVGQLAGGIAHDFNNLLTIINGHCELLEDDLDQTDSRRESIEEIREAGERAAELTQQLLLYSRKAKVELRPIDLNAIISRAETLLRRLIGTQIVLTIQLASNLDTIKADGSQLQQVIMNLAVNARDAMPHGGRLTIVTQNEEINDAESSSSASLPPGRYVRLTVADTGDGMTEEVRARIFEPFYTTKPVGVGTGLGMAVVHGIIRQSQGFIRVSSNPGAGAAFAMWFPSVADRPQETVDVLLPTPTGTNASILLVEDEAGVRKMLRKVLEGAGHLVYEAEEGASALKLMKENHHHIDLLFTDVMMPGINGFSLADRLRRDRPDLPVLFISGYAANLATSNRAANTYDAFLQKPCSPLRVLQAIHELLERTLRTS